MFPELKLYVWPIFKPCCFVHVIIKKINSQKKIPRIGKSLILKGVYMADKKQFG